MLVHNAGLYPFVSPKTSYTSTGAAVSFTVPGNPNPVRSSQVTINVYAGTALISLLGSPSGPFIEVGEGGAFDFPIETEALYIKSTAGNTQVAVVAVINPTGKNPRG